jgi:mRNA-degrading endonuclease RelE of RelBE toxin-antitoxin system
MAITGRRIYNKLKKLLDNKYENKYEIKKLKDISQNDIGLIRILLSVNSDMKYFLLYKEKSEEEEYEFLKNSLTYNECFNTLLGNEVIKLK